MNTDGSLDLVSRRAGSGFVIRGSQGQFVAAGCTLHRGINDPFMSELLACRDGLEEAAHRGLQNVVLQTDCSNLVDLWHDPRRLRLDGIHILDDLKMISQSFQVFKLLYIGREANSAAHVCAREALSIDSPRCFDIIPGFLSDTLRSDCNSNSFQ